MLYFPLALVSLWEFGVLGRPHFYILGLIASSFHPCRVCAHPLCPLHSISSRGRPAPWGSMAKWAPDTPGHAAEACIFHISHLPACVTHTCGQYCLENTGFTGAGWLWLRWTYSGNLENQTPVEERSIGRWPSLQPGLLWEPQYVS